MASPRETHNQATSAQLVSSRQAQSVYFSFQLLLAQSLVSFTIHVLRGFLLLQQRTNKHEALPFGCFPHDDSPRLFGFGHDDSAIPFGRFGHYSDSAMVVRPSYSDSAMVIRPSHSDDSATTWIRPWWFGHPIRTRPWWFGHPIRTIRPLLGFDHDDSTTISGLDRDDSAMVIRPSH